MLDQLYYTSARDGLDGRPGFQAVAASAGLMAQDDRIASAALRLCRYELDGIAPDQAPISYGWINTGKVRFVFHRVFAGPDEFGRPGNFYAHVVAGRPEELPVPELIRRFGSDFWWRGQPIVSRIDGPEGRRLPATTLDEIPQGPELSADAADVRRLIEIILATGQRNRIAARLEPATMMAVAEGAARALPHLVDGLSISTYESASTCQWFDVVGIRDATPLPPGTIRLDEHPEAPPGSVIRRVSQLAISPEADDRQIVWTAVRTARSEGDGIDIDVFVRVADTIDGLSSGRQVDVAGLLPALQQPSAADALLEREASRTAVARAAVDGRADIWSALQATAGQLDPRHLVGLGAELGTIVTIHRPDAVGPVVNAASRLPSALQRACFDPILEAAADDRGLVEQLDDGARRALLRRAAEVDATVPSAATTLLSTGSPEVAAHLAASRDLPVGWRAQALAGLLAKDASAAELAARILAAEPKATRPELARRLAGNLEGHDPLTMVLRHLGPGHAASLALQAAPALGSEQRVQLLSVALERLPLPDRLPFLHRCATVGSSATDPWWASAVIRGTTDAIQHALERTTLDPVPPPEAVALLDGVNDRRARAWGRFVHSLGSADQGDPISGRVLKSLDHLRRSSDPDWAVAAELALSVRVRTSLSLRDLELLLHDLYGYHPPLDASAIASRVLRAGVRNLRLGHKTSSAAVCVTFVARRIDHGQLQVRRSGALQHPQLQELAADIVGNLSPTVWEPQLYRISGMGKATTRWLRTLPRPLPAGANRAQRLLTSLRKAVARR